MALTRQIALAHVADFGRNICHALTSAGIPTSEQSAICESHLKAKCAVCERPVGGRTLATVFLGSEPLASADADPISRLRLGYCQSLRCNSAYYEFTFAPHASIDWSQIPVAASGHDAVGKSTGNFWQLAAQSGTEAIKRQLTWRLAAALAILLALWMTYQWRSGGRIPILREPKTYTGQVPDDVEPLPKPVTD